MGEIQLSSDCAKPTNRQPISYELLEMGRDITTEIEEVALYSKEKLAPISLKRDNELEKGVVFQEWPELFDMLRALFDRIDRATNEIRNNLDSAEI